MKSDLCLIVAMGLSVGCASSKDARAFLSFTEVERSELGTCCQSCSSSLEIDRTGAFTFASTGALTCQAKLSAAETNQVVALVTSPDVVQAMSDPAACGGEAAASEGDEMRVDFSDGTSIDNPAAGGCNEGPLDTVRRALLGFDQEYCPTLTCAEATAAASK
jgi:hypothetical protein